MTIENITSNFYKIFESDDVIKNLQQISYTENTSYLSEYPSILIFLNYLYGCTDIYIDQNSLLSNIYKYSSLLIDSIKKNEHNNHSLCYGFTGIAHAFNYCYEKTNLFQNVAICTENILEKLAASYLDSFFDNMFNNLKTKESHYDLLLGLSGTALYFLEKEKLTSSQSSLAIKILDYFSKLIFSTNFQNCVIHPEDMVTEYLAGQYPLGYINMGVSHGILAPMYALSIGYKKYNKPSYKDAIEHILSLYTERIISKYDFIKKQRLLCWQSRIGIDSNFSNDFNQNNSWCYGNLGISRVLYLISKNISNTPLQQTALDVALSSLNTFHKSEFLPSSICHGLSGKMMILDQFYNDTKIEDFRKSSNNLFHIITERSSTSNKYLFIENDIYFRGKIYKSPISYIDLGLLNGNTGIIIALLGHINGNYYPINKLFIA